MIVFSVIVLSISGCAPGNRVQDRAPGPDEQTHSGRPNILWLVAEDLGYYLPAFGDSTIATPNLDRLASESVRYTHVYSPSGVCAPSRAALATGMYPVNIGAMHMRTGPWYLGRPPEATLESARQSAPSDVGIYEAIPPPEVKMIGEYLRMAGYFASNRPKQDYQFLAPVTAWDETGPEAHWRHRRPGQSFFAVVNFQETHESRLFPSGRPLRVSADLEVNVPPYLPDTEPVRNDLRRLYSNILEMDEAVGEVLDQLREDGLFDSTYIFWFADNGGPLPREKRTLYDVGIRVPLMIRFPNGEQAGAVDDQLISFVDFLPTVLAIAGVASPDVLPGRAFLGLGTLPPPREYFFAAADRLDSEYDRIRAVGDGRFKYLRNLMPERGYYLPLAFRENIPTMQELLRLREAGGLTPDQSQWFRPSKPVEELFDTVRDRYELRNLASDPDHRAKLVELRRQLEAFESLRPDLGLMQEPDYVASIWPDGKQPGTKPPEIAISDEFVTISCETPGASIGYQILQKDEPLGPSWQVYSNPFRTVPGAVIAAVGHRLGYLPSEVVSLTQ